MSENLVMVIRKLLNERDIDYEESQDRFRTRFRFNYCSICSDYLNEIEVMGSCITASKSYLTPEQAISVIERPISRIALFMENTTGDSHA